MSKRNPRKKVPEEKFCGYIYPDDYKDPSKIGVQCGSMHMKNSEFCYFHQENQEQMREQLGKARKNVEYGTQTKHGLYTDPARRKCDTCPLAVGCVHVEPGKMVCDYSLKPEVDLSTLENIKDVTEELLRTEMNRYRKLEPFFDMEYENMELFDLSSRIAKRMTAILKDYASVKATYEKNRKIDGWADFL